MAQTETINDLKIRIAGKTYEISGGGGCIPAPNSVGTEQIIDGAVQIEDMNQDTMANSGDIDDIFNGQDVGHGGGEDTDDDETGFETVADDGEGDI